jgi:hypothetical protein
VVAAVRGKQYHISLLLTTITETGGMELSIKTRKTTRMYFTKTYNNLLQILSEQEPSEETVKVKFSAVEIPAKHLSAQECNWYDANYEAKEDEDFELEYAAIEEYK